jgi:hypothetical protein
MLGRGKFLTSVETFSDSQILILGCAYITFLVVWSPCSQFQPVRVELSVPIITL